MDIKRSTDANNITQTIIILLSMHDQDNRIMVF